MDVEMVLNELSINPPAKDVESARQLMVDFIATTQKAARQGVKKVIRTDYNLHSALLSAENGYTIGRWLKDDLVNRDIRTFFLGLAASSPFLKDIKDINLVNQVESSQFLYIDEEVRGLGIAYLLDALAISLRSHPQWYPASIELKFIHIDDDELIENLVQVTHASHQNHILEHDSWIKERINTEIRKGIDVWQQRERLFPNLQFCDAAGEALQGFNSGNSPFQLIVKKLLELEKFCLQWQKQKGAFDPRAIPLSGAVARETALNKYAREHTFRCPDGKERVFSLHVRITQYWRLHYYPLAEKQQLIIGYIGEHLPTKNFS